MMIENVMVTMPFALDEKQIKEFNKVSGEKLLPTQRFNLNDNYYFFRKCWCSPNALVGGTNITFSFRCKRKFTDIERERATEDLKTITAYIFNTVAKDTLRRFHGKHRHQALRSPVENQR